jgi:hypothetical protein
MLEDYCVDLYCGLGGWAEGFLAEGFKVIGFDIERHDYGTGTYPGDLVLQDVLTLHGSQFKYAAVIVASPPCTEPSYRAMPWKRAKALNAIGPPHKFIALFEACFRIQREASEAAGKHIPLIVENVVGAQPWVGRAPWHFGSYYLWGDIPALMPIPSRRAKVSGQDWNRFAKTGEVSPHWRMQVKTQDHLNIRDGHSHTRHLTNPDEHIKQSGISGMRNNGKGDRWFQDGAAQHGSKSKARKAASAQIAKIPFPLARHIARCFKDFA